MPIEYLNAVNIITAVIVLLMLYFQKNYLPEILTKIDFFYIMALIALGIGLYLWRSGAAVDLITSIRGAM